MSQRINQLTLRGAEDMAIELAGRGEKHAAHVIASLLAIIEDLTAPPPQRPGPKIMWDLDLNALSVGDRIEVDGKSVTILVAP